MAAAGPAAAPMGSSKIVDEGKILSILFFYRPLGRPASDSAAYILAQAYNIGDYSFICRGSVREFLTFSSRTLAAQTEGGNRVSICYKEYIGHCVSRPDGLVCVVMCDDKYPPRVAHGIAQRMLNEFKSLHESRVDFSRINKDTELAYGPLERYIVEYQKPSTADPLLRVQKGVEETKVILVQAFEQVMDRQGNLEALMAKSNDLSAVSRKFYKTSEKLNCNCVML